MSEQPFYQPPSFNIAGEGDLVVEMSTRLGVIKARLFEAEAPQTVRNFVALAQGVVTGVPFYDGLVFHRCIPRFMAQTGCPNGDGTGDAGYRIHDEFGHGLRHAEGSLSMANDGPDSGGSQFFICERATPWLDHKHAVFGQVIEGMFTLRKMLAEPRDGDDTPKTAIRIKKLKLYRES